MSKSRVPGFAAAPGGEGGAVVEDEGRFGARGPLTSQFHIIHPQVVK